MLLLKLNVYYGINKKKQKQKQNLNCLESMQKKNFIAILQ